MEPSRPGWLKYKPDMPGASFGRVQVVRYKGVLMARLFDGDEFELHPVADLTGTWKT